MDDANQQCFNPNTPRGSHSDDEMILASSCPKKRAGRKKFKETRHPVYRGVRQRNGDRWVCEVRAPNNNNRIWLGTYPTAEMAARAHDVAALALRGRNACLNFADSAWRLSVPSSTETRDIQRAAAEAAEAFRGETDNIKDHVMEGYAGENEVKSNDNEVLQENGEYVDDEAVYDMPGLLVNMAEGLLIPPPQNGFSWNESDNDECEVSLWSYSI